MKNLIKCCSILLLFLLAGCLSVKDNDDGDFFKEVINNYFGMYNPHEEIWIDKSVSKFSITKISKVEFSTTEFNLVRKKLAKDGWILVADQDGYYQYCLGENFHMGILYPSKKIHHNSAGEEVRYTDKDKWQIGLSYSEGGVKYCLANPLPIIELD